MNQIHTKFIYLIVLKILRGAKDNKMHYQLQKMLSWFNDQAGHTFQKDALSRV